MKAPNRAAEILSRLSDIIKDAPDYDLGAPIGDQEHRWQRQAEALLGEAGLVRQLSNFRAAARLINTSSFNRGHLMSPLHSASSILEIQREEDSQEDFIAGAGAWKGYGAVVRVLQTPCNDLLIVDPHLDLNFFMELAPQAATKGTLRCLTSSQKPSGLKTLYEKYVREGRNEVRPLNVKVAPLYALRDELMIMDRKDVRRVSQSLKDIERPFPVSITRVDPELARMKIDHYEDIWSSAKAL